MTAHWEGSTKGGYHVTAHWEGSTRGGYHVTIHTGDSTMCLQCIKVTGLVIEYAHSFSPVSLGHRPMCRRWSINCRYSMHQQHTAVPTYAYCLLVSSQTTLIGSCSDKEVGEYFKAVFTRLAEDKLPQVRQSVCLTKLA